jgi:hypothetical protein
MLAAGVDMPQGRTQGKESSYSYLDSNGNPQELQVCFRSIPWLTEITAGVFADQVRNVMVIKQATPDVARLIDSLVDTSRDARFGQVRQYPSQASIAGTASADYGLDNTCVQGAGPTGCGTALDEAQVATMTLYYVMDN